MHDVPASASETVYWLRPGLDVRGGRLRVAGRDVIDVTTGRELPLYLVDLQRIGEQARALQRALANAGLRHRVRLALKAQRQPETLRYVRSLGEPGSDEAVGIDACSPGEVQRALACGWSPEEISFTGTNLSDEDLDLLLRHRIHINVDLLSQLELVGRRSPGRQVGIRVNPRAGAAWAGGETLYSGSKPTKFGLYAEQLETAVAIARRHGLVITTVHFHVADGFLNDGLPAVEQAVKAAAEMACYLRESGCPLVEVNTGGGLGVPLRADDQPLDLEAWADVMRRHLGPLDVTVGTEPGNFLVKESAVVVGRIVSIEDRLGTRFVGLNFGWNVMSYRFLYHKPFEVILCRDPLAPALDCVTVSGNINEGDDLFAEEYPFPDAREGDLVAILAVGGYNQAMQSSHCLRLPARTLCFWDRLP